MTCPYYKGRSPIFTNSRKTCISCSRLYNIWLVEGKKHERKHCLGNYPECPIFKGEMER